MTDPDPEPTPVGSGSQLLDDRMCFVLYAASRAVTGVYRPLLDGLGLTYPQYLVLLALWERGELSVKQLGSMLYLDYGTLTPLLKRLEANGLIRRERRPDDERTVTITLTADGIAMRERARDIPGKIGEAMGMGPDTAEEFENARTVLLGMIDRINRGGSPRR
ncbi:MAG: MarR family transcriptional regulator [Streptomyces sp.]|nr:MarR family transcriptional regulator [Streptomyces sp.]